MTSRSLFLQTALLAAFGTLVIPLDCAAQSTPVVAWQLVESKPTFHEPVLLRLTVQNTADTEAEFDFGHSFTKGLAIRITDTAGRPAGVPVPEPSGLGESGVVRIEPRATYVRDFVVNNWYSFGHPGTYLIGVTLRNSILLGEQAIAPPPEAFDTLVVEELDEARLRRTCEALFSRISLPLTNAANVDDAWQAMGALVQIHHPIAIEFLVRSLDVPIVVAAGRALGPLADFGTPEALEALIEASRPGASNSAMARGHLGRVAAKIQDPLLRARAHAAVQAAPAPPLR
jgi:hypothetical protein